MCRYVSDISMISHYIIKEFLQNRSVAIDATLGNGYDTDFLLPYLKVLPKSKFGVMYYSFFYRSEEAPILIVIEKITLRKGRVLWKMYITITLKLAK
ncbi:hypothetical protein [Clostridium beijerinckii]|uniref:hypothetical protein n=1 Tax=Clostridium beijerinckii TaxID=1520 RepID=UPI0009D3B062|nr:hypothetical protein [Clostridium beijerinckii]MBA8937413.1 hypothetical protein [Clostridium beijerinckii]NRT32804.1 hypothetical protein [Clostridium beijerinckii]NRT47770.1 hypothetical protein [Clostridium beijerinckii]NRU41494.1 hypothetical protein [Clostridium beijerinckii]NRZ23937.1 hypothetical protein [Clostridium beijerinckii]